MIRYTNIHIMNDPMWTDDQAPAEPPKKKSPALWKQLLGACGGAVVALMLYAGYQWGGEHLGSMAGYLTPPGWRDSAATPVKPTRRDILAQAETQQMDHVAEQARRMADALMKSSASFSSSSSSGKDMDTSDDILETLRASNGAVQWAASSADSDASVHTGSRWSPPSQAAHGDALPDSGFPIVGIIGAAFGSSVMRFRRKRA